MILKKNRVKYLIYLNFKKMNLHQNIVMILQLIKVIKVYKQIKYNFSKIKINYLPPIFKFLKNSIKIILNIKIIINSWIKIMNSKDSKQIKSTLKKSKIKKKKNFNKNKMILIVYLNNNRIILFQFNIMKF